MTSINPRTADNPEAAMLHQPTIESERERIAQGGQLPAPHAESIDRAAYDSFMRKLG